MYQFKKKDSEKQYLANMVKKDKIAFMSVTLKKLL